MLGVNGTCGNRLSRSLADCGGVSEDNRLIYSSHGWAVSMRLIEYVDPELRWDIKGWGVDDVIVYNHVWLLGKLLIIYSPGLVHSELYPR
jgi:hypothetical protein